jgi:hypothetical protein
MKHRRGPEWFLILVFLGTIGIVPLIQVGLEARRGEWPQALAVLRQRPTAKNLRAYERGLEEASWVARQLRPWAMYAQFAWFKDGGDKTLIGKDGWFFYRPGVQYLTEKPVVTKATSTPAEAAGAIAAFRDQLAARGIQLLVLPVPNKESVYPEKLSRRAQGRPSAVCPQTRELLDRLRTNGVEVVDLFAIYQAAKGQPAAGSQALYLAQDTHWSPAGLDVAAQAVAQRVLARGWLARGQAEWFEKPAPVQRLGDVLQMLQLPRLEQQTAPETIACRQVVQGAPGALYRDDPASEVLVLGDSFLRIYEQDEPGAAGFIAHLARELGRPLASIVSDGGASTLVRQELYRRSALLRNKKVVIWEFVERDIRFGAEGWQPVPLPAITL